jgi:S1-C subfamily serine protease
MTLVDWIIVAFAAALVPLGWRQGLIVGLTTLAGFAVGAVIGARLAPLLLSDGSESPYAPAIALLGGVVVGGVLALLLEGFGHSLRERLVRGRPAGLLDAAGGAVVLVLLALAISWVLGAAVLNAPALREARDDVQRSRILASLYEVLPPSGPLLNVLNRIDVTPRVRGPEADVAAPERGVAADPDVREASRSVVRVLGTACGLSVSGSGWAGGDELVVTNAHVVAGEDETTIVAPDGRELTAEAVVYRPRDDLAVLRAPGLGLAELELVEDPRSGTAGAVIGYPGGGDLTLRPARLGTTGVVNSQDSYGRGPIRREMTSLRGRVESGNSGGPMIDADGRVLTTIFASTLDAQRPEGLGVPNGIVTAVLERAAQREGVVGTGPCA